MGMLEKFLYLGGAIDGQTYEGCTEWREYAIKELAKEGIIGISHMRGKEFLKKHQVLRDGVEKHVLTTDEGITTRDMWDVRRSGAVLFNLLNATKISIGTMIEYGWASAFSKPIITVMEREGSRYEHAIVRGLTSFRVDTLDSGLAVARALFNY